MSAYSGDSNGKTNNSSYGDVCSGNTGHNEVAREPHDVSQTTHHLFLF
ncbi:MAG: peptide-methionine (S)-S-oxide reductase [Glaciecola sp.]